MEEVKETKTEQTQKFTYEQLEQIASNLSAQVQQLGARLQEANMINTFKRLDYCFKVLEVSNSLINSLFSDQFVENCAKEIEDLMTPVQEESEKEE